MSGKTTNWGSGFELPERPPHSPESTLVPPVSRQDTSSLETTRHEAPAETEPFEVAPEDGVEDRGPVTAVYDRKEVYLRPDQLEELLVLERRLRRQRPRGVGERLTANSLIRVAVDLLLDRQDRLSGWSEAQLRESVGLPRSSGG